jgi:hypothetical protein
MNPARGLVLAVCFGVIAWSSRAMAETGASLSALPLKDRCAVALLIAKEVREAMEISPQGARGLDDLRKLRILISRTADGEEPVSIFRNHEDCGNVSLPLTWTQGVKSDVEFAVGNPRKLEPVEYQVVSVSSRASPGWEFIWPLNRAYVGCERDADPRMPKICLGLALPSTWPWGHLPALRVKIKRLGNDPAARHEFLVDEAALLIIRAGLAR